MCSNLHCIIGSNVTETNCGTQALIVAANDGVCFIPDHMQHFSLHFRPQLRSGFDSVIRITCCNLHSLHHSDFLTLSRPKPGGSQRDETQGVYVDYEMARRAPSIYDVLLIRAICITLKICLLQCVIVTQVTHPVSVTALTWYEK